MHRSRNREGRRAWLLLGLLSAVFVVFSLWYLPRLNNFVMGDRDFTGWAGPIAARLRAGQRPYLDFVLPIPPGAFLLLAAIQKVMGRELVLQELALIALLQLGMAWAAYAMATPLTSRKNAVLVAVCSLAVLIQAPREIAYDPASLICAWGSLAVGVRALCAAPGSKRRRLWAITGLVAALALAFKQSTANGILLGWLAAFAYLIASSRRSAKGFDPKLWRDLGAWALGALGGCLIAVLVVLATGAGLPAYAHAVLVDGPSLKGGLKTLAANFFMYLFISKMFPGSLVLIGLAVVIGLTVARVHRDLRLGDEPERKETLGWAAAGAIAGAVIIAFGAAITLLAIHVRSLPPRVLSIANAVTEVPAFGVAFGCMFLVGQSWPRSSTSDQEDRHERVSHAFNGAFIVAVVCALVNGLSYATFEPFLRNSPLLAVSFLFVFVALGRARLGWLSALAALFVLFGLFGIKLDRALSDNTAVGPRGDWAGMIVNYRGEEILRAARRARRLAGPHGSVLVLPEDVELAALIGRPRPPLRGAIVFVDQYPARLAKADIQTLDRHPPKVIVVSPRQEGKWRRLFAMWSSHSGAARVVEHVLHHLLPERYRLDRSFRSVYFWDQGRIDVYVRRGGSGEQR